MTEIGNVRSLTQTEAQERAALLAVGRYDIEFDLTGIPEGPEVRSVSTVTFTSREVGATTFVDCCADVVRATLNGVELPAAAEGRITLPDLAEHNTLVVESVQADTTDGEGVHRAVDPADKEVYLWTSFEPDEARHVWACFDQPDLKAPHAFTVTAPKGWTVTSNMGDPQVDVLEDARRWTFPATPPLSTYNPVVNAGPFHEVRRSVGGFDLGLFARKTLANVLDRDADELFEVTAQGLAFFGEQFGMPFPEAKYDQVFLPELGGAMENYACVSWSDAFLSRHEPSPAEREQTAKVLLHEMAHMWFGNIVTMRWWDDLWLNEAFAEFACNWAAERATRYTDAWASHLAGEKLDAYLADQGPISHPIALPVRDVEEAASIFDAITYPKGASVLQQLMTYVGEEVFRRGMTNYFAKNAWGNTTLQDLIDELAAVSGRDLDAWREGWLATAGTDRLTLEQGDDGPVLVAHGPNGHAPRPQVLGIGAYKRGPGGLDRVALARVEVAGERTPVALEKGADVYLVNDEDLTFATARPDADTRDALFAAASELPSAISRAVAVATVWDMLMTAEATADEVIRTLTSVLRVETSEAVIEPYLQLACTGSEQWSSDATREAIMGQVAATCRELADDDTLRQVALRAMARTATSTEDLLWVHEQAGNDVDVQWRALVRRAEVGEVSDAEIQALLAADPDPDAWVRALTVRAARPSAEDKHEAYETLLARKVPISQSGQVARALWRPGQGEVTGPYAERYLEGLSHFDRGGMIPAMMLTHWLMPMFGIDEEFLARAQAVADADAAPVVRKGVTERSDELRRMLRARTA